MSMSELIERAGRIGDMRTRLGQETGNEALLALADLVVAHLDADERYFAARQAFEMSSTLDMDAMRLALGEMAESGRARATNTLALRVAIGHTS